MQIALPLLAALTAFASSAPNTRLNCRDGAGGVIFSGLVTLRGPEPDSDFTRERSFSYAARIPSHSAYTADRATLSRYGQGDLPGCEAPYAQVFVKDEKPGSLRCASGEVKTLTDLDESDAGLLRALGLSDQEAKCALFEHAPSAEAK